MRIDNNDYKDSFLKIEEYLKTKDNYTKKQVFNNVKTCWDQVAKPLDSMGKFERIFCQIGSIQNTTKIDISKKLMVIMCADNGVVEEGISQSDQDVTAIVTQKMGLRDTSVCNMAKVGNIDILPIDIGVNCNERFAGVIDKKVAYGTKNFAKEAAMTRTQLIDAINVGIDAVRECKEKGYNLIGTGEMGIGNTTTSSAIAASLLQCKANTVTGKGAGLSNEGLERKIAVIDNAIRKYDLYNKSAFDILKIVGGFDIAGLVGVYIGGAIYDIPVVIDGIISLVALFVAEKLVRGVASYAIPSHISNEPEALMIFEKLEISPIIDANMALGEGTGAVMKMSLLDMVYAVYEQNHTFDTIGLKQYERM